MAVYFSALAATVAAQLSPGPNLLAVAGVALGQGRLPAVATAGGVATGAALWVLSLALGISALFHAYPVLIVMLQLIGGSYFIYVGLRALRSAINGGAMVIESHKAMMTPGTAFRNGLLVVLTNPKAAIMWASIVAFMTTSGLSTMGVLLFAPIGGLSALIIYSGYGLLFSTNAAQGFYKKTVRAFQSVYGATFSGLGAYFIFSGLKDMFA